MLPKVLVGCPTSSHKEYCLKQYAETVKSLTYPNYNILLVDNTKNDYYINKIKELKIPVTKGLYFEHARDRIIHSRNILREKVLNKNYDYLFSLEQDVIPPKDIIEKLLKLKKDIITGVYFTYQTQKNKTKLLPLLYKKTEKKDIHRQLKPKEINPPRKILIKSCGLGCVLISKKVLKKVKFRYDKKLPAFDDMFFCQDARKEGFRIIADTSIRCKHLIKKWSWNDIKQ